MTHFTVLVFGADIEAQLAPYDEELEVSPYPEEDGQMTTYNPDSKWDWYEVGGRWSGRLNGNDQTTVGELNWDDIQRPHAIVMEGVWLDRGEAGYFGFVGDENAATFDAMWDRLPNLAPDTVVTLVDCHI